MVRWQRVSFYRLTGDWGLTCGSGGLTFQPAYLSNAE
jgi:hypothetical protein